MSSFFDDSPGNSGPLVPPPPARSPARRALLWSLPFILLALGAMVAGQMWLARNSPDSPGGHWTAHLLARLPAALTRHLPVDWQAAPPMDVSPGVLFFDAQRTQPYWASDASRHPTRAAAVAALATHYGKPAAWIEAHMGASNDLAQIRQRLDRAAAPRPRLQADPDRRNADVQRVEARFDAELAEMKQMADDKKEEIDAIARQKAERYRIRPGMSQAEIEKNRRQFEEEMQVHVDAALTDLQREAERRDESIERDAQKIR